MIYYINLYKYHIKESKYKYSLAQNTQHIWKLDAYLGKMSNT